MANWMWYPDDFELYHAMLVHNRRERRGDYYSPMWRVDAPHRNVRLYKIVELEKSEEFFAKANEGTLLEIIVNGVRWQGPARITLQPGRNFIKLSAFKDGGLPAIWCEGEHFDSGKGWQLASFGMGDDPAGTNDMYDSPDDNPEVFKFSYKRLYPVSREEINDGVLFDFGREIMGKLVFSDIKSEGKKVPVFYGESREEALDTAYTEVTDVAVLSGKETLLRSRACRYVFLEDSCNDFSVAYDFEYLPIAPEGKFKCDDELVNKIWNISAYTLELNSREGFFDGIKRDRWIWSGDAYQSYFVNYYYACDLDIVRRTTMMLRGEGKMAQHINTIVDYTFYWIIAIWEYYYHTGDKAFIERVYKKMPEMWELVGSRLSEHGFIGGYTRKGDWTFIDWSTHLEKTEIISAEQMLLYRSYVAYAEILELLGKDGTEYRRKAVELKNNIDKYFWDDEKKAYIDSYQSGNRTVNRHANIFALLFGIANEKKRSLIIENVIRNDSVPPITTPYFEFFELDAMCEIGEFGYVTDMLHSYWGGMVKLGATTFWEEYFPNMKGAEHYAMYGKPYSKSLCHAWSASPIYLMGKYALGVRPTSAAYKTYEVVPNLMCFGKIEGSVPVPGGVVSVKVDKHNAEVTSDIGGGVLVLGDKRYDIKKGETLKVQI